VTAQRSHKRGEAAIWKRRLRGGWVRLCRTWNGGGLAVRAPL